LFQTWNSNKPGFEKLNSRSEPGFEKQDFSVISEKLYSTWSANQDMLMYKEMELSKNDENPGFLQN
jgi:hypothetical protein